MPQGFLQVFRRIEVVLEKKLHSSLTRFTPFSHAIKSGPK
jgi:hypothetical protein